MCSFFFKLNCPDTGFSSIQLVDISFGKIKDGEALFEETVTFRFNPVKKNSAKKWAKLECIWYFALCIECANKIVNKK